MPVSPHRRGFTLIELLLVMGIISTLAGIVIVAINPTKQFNSAKDATRISAVKELQNALTQYQIDNGALPNDSSVPVVFGLSMPLCRQGVSGDATCINVDALLPKYLAALPQDTSESNANYIGYKVYKNNGRPTVTSTYLAGSILTTGLVGYWKFDETSGTTAADSSGNGISGAVTGALHSATIPPAIQFADPRTLSFNGASDYVDMGNPAALQSFTTITWAAWVYSTNIAKDQIFISKGVNGNWFRIIGNALMISLMVPSQVYFTGSPTLVSNTWYHVAFTYDGSTIKVYLNGNLYGSSTSGNGALNFNTGNFIIGQYAPNSSTYAMQGNMDDVRIYNRVLTQAELTSLAGGAN